MCESQFDTKLAKNGNALGCLIWGQVLGDNAGVLLVACLSSVIADKVWVTLLSQVFNVNYPTRGGYTCSLLSNCTAIHVIASTMVSHDLWMSAVIHATVDTGWIIEKWKRYLIHTCIIHVIASILTALDKETTEYCLWMIVLSSMKHRRAHDSTRMR